MSIAGTNSNDTLIGTSANDSINGGNGNDTIVGGSGNDNLSGDNGNDVIDGGSGSDVLFGNNGDDTAVYVAVDNLAAHDTYDGGLGNDTLVLKLTQSQLNEMNASTVFADFRAAAGGGATFDFSAYGFSFNIHLTAKGFEQIQTVLIADPAPPAAHADVNAIAEDGASSSVSGNVLVNDSVGGIVDAALSIINAGAVGGHYGTLTLNADGTYSYVLDQTNAAVDALNDGETLQETFAYTITDGYSHATSQLSVTINGHTDPAPPVAHRDANAITEDGASSTIAGNVLANDDVGGIAGTVLTVTNAGVVSGLYGTLTLNADGSYGYVLDQTKAALDALDDGGTLQETFAYTIGNGFGESTSQLTITISGHTDPPLFTAGDDVIDFNTIVAGSYRAGTQYDALDGNDTVILPDSVAAAAAAGYALGTAFHTGDGHNTVFGGGMNDVIVGGNGSDTIDGGAGNDVLSGGAGDDLLTGGAGNNLVDGGTGIDTYVLKTAGVVSLWNGVALTDGGTDHLVNIENAYGSAFDDLLLGDNSDNTLAGGGGNDRISAEGGNDIVIGGAGSDDLNGGAGINRIDYSGLDVGVRVVLGPEELGGGFARKGDAFNPPFDTPFDQLKNFQEVVGSNFSDSIRGDAQDNSIFGGSGTDFLNGDAGNDHLDGGAGDDRLDGGAGDDQLDGGAGADFIDAGAGNDLIDGGAGNDQIDGGAGDDRIDGGDGDDFIFAGAGNDRLVGGAGHDHLDGGDGDDLFISDGIASAIVGGNGIDAVDYSVAQFGLQILPGTLIGIENIIGSQYDDMITGDGGNNRISGGGGNDIVIGGMGNDDLDGGAGINRLDYQGTFFPVVINLADGVAIKGDPTFFIFGTDQVRNFQEVVGSNGGDHIVGDAQDNLFLGFGGNDVLDGGAGNDRIEGGGDDDVMIGSAGNDYFDGGEGVDRVVYEGSGVGVTVVLGPEGFVRKGDAADAPVDQLRDVEDVTGSSFEDHIVGDASNNRFLGGVGNDVLEGGAGNDFLSGDKSDFGDPADHAGDGDDILYGGAGDDIMLGGGGDDTLVGGPGRDFMLGGGGDDLFISDAINNAIQGGDGYDTIDYSGVLFDLAIQWNDGFAGEAPFRTIYPVDYPFLPDAFSGIESIIGGQGNDKIIGNQADNRINGFHGNDILAGLGGHDVFHVDLSDTSVGNDTIMDFQIGIDKISLGGGLHASLSELNPHQVGANTVLDLGEGIQLTLFQLNASLLTNNDFIFA